jgi:hypothetical protein
LYEGATGLRSEETVLLRMDARSDEPGGLTPDGRSMCFRRARKSKKFNLYVQVHEGLKLIRQAHKMWHAKRYPLSPWCFPGRERKTLRHVNKSPLTKSLDRLHQVYVDFRKTEKDPKEFPKKPHLTRKYTSHGAGRAFYVLVRRSQGVSDPQIAYELNQIGGVGTLEQVYGLPPEHWKNGNAPLLTEMKQKYRLWQRRGKVPVNDLVSNWAYRVMATLAWKLKAWYGLLTPKRERGLELVRMEFRRFLHAIVLLPCQIVRTPRRVICRILGYNPWLKDFFATWERVRQMAPVEVNG